MARYRNGYDSALSPIIAMYYAPLYKLACYKVRNVEDAKDITQTVFLDFVRAVRRGDSIPNASLWLFKVAFRRIIDCLRRRKIRRAHEPPRDEQEKDGTAPLEALEVIPASKLLDPENLLLLRELLRALHECLCAFRPKKVRAADKIRAAEEVRAAKKIRTAEEIRAVLVAYLNGLSPQQIADLLGVEPTWVNNRLARNKLQLWNCLQSKLSEIGASHENE